MPTLSDVGTEIASTVTYLGDRHDIAWIIGGLLLVVEVDKEGRSRAEEQGVIVVRTEESIERHETVAARAILDYDRLTPVRG
ncbi:MAG TPA: hypothetical protein VHZ64_00455 [Xanthobacteraceae bacterium]|nr:hypothetical protein [Xanthobacteraceae bacterium]